MAGTMNTANARQHNKNKTYYEHQKVVTEKNLARKGKTNKKKNRGRGGNKVGNQKG